MSSEKKQFFIASAMGCLLGLLCALVLGGVFYGAMAYQVLGEEQLGAAQVQPASKGTLLAIADAQLLSEQTVQQEMGGESCTVTVRVYEAQDGRRIEAVSASPAAYIERLSQEGWTPQLVTGYTLAGMEAVCSRRGEEYMLSARADERIYMLRAAMDEQALYTLGAGAALE